MPSINQKHLSITPGGFRVAWMIPIEAIGYTIMVPLVRMVGFVWATIIVSILIIYTGKFVAKAVARADVRDMLAPNYVFKPDKVEVLRKRYAKELQQEALARQKKAELRKEARKEAALRGRRHLPASAI